MKKVFLIILLASLLAVSCSKTVSTDTAATAPGSSLLAPSTGAANLYTVPLTIASRKLFVQVVTTPSDMAQGLSDRPSMPGNTGMLFDFGAQAQSVNFWMKDMRFALDFLWVANGKIIGITKNVPAPKTAAYPLPLYPPPSPTNQVIEVNAGWAEKNNIKIGDSVQF